MITTVTIILLSISCLLTLSLIVSSDVDKEYEDIEQMEWIKEYYNKK